MSLEEKKREVEHLHDELSRTPHAILVDFRGLDVAGATDLRRRLHDEDARFRVVKNSIALRAIEDLPLAELRESFQGQTAIAYTGGDVVVLAKTLREFAKEFETPTFKAGVVDGEPITVEEFESIADLPSRDELIGKALYLLQYPVSGLVTALNGIVRGFVVALGQVRDKKESGELPAGEAEVAAPQPEEAADAEEEEVDAGGEGARAADETGPPDEAKGAEEAEATDEGEADEAAEGAEGGGDAEAPDEAGQDTDAEAAGAEDPGEEAAEEAKAEPVGTEEPEKEPGEDTEPVEAGAAGVEAAEVEGTRDEAAEESDGAPGEEAASGEEEESRE